MKLSQFILPVVSGTMSGMILQVFGEKAIRMAYPLPAGVINKDTLEAYNHGLPALAFLLLISNLAICAFLAGMISSIVAGRISRVPSIFTGIILAIGSLYMAANMPGQPIWFTAVSILLYVPMALLAFAVVSKK